MDTSELRQIKDDFDRQNDLRILGLGLVAAFLGVVALFHAEGRAIFGFSPGNIMLVLFLILGVFFLFKLARHRG